VFLEGWGSLLRASQHHLVRGYQPLHRELEGNLEEHRLVSLDPPSPHPRNQGIKARDGLPRQEVIHWLRDELEAAKEYALAGPVKRGQAPRDGSEALEITKHPHEHARIGSPYTP
jgi:hypothetical protein